MIDPSPHFQEREQRLMDAIKCGDFAEATSVLDSGADPRVPDMTG
jgi:hypothetical protein